MPLSEFNRKIWLWLFNNGGYWTAEEVARRVGEDPYQVFKSLHAMARRGLVVKHKSQFHKRLSYGIDGTCFVPKGMRIAEVQE